MSTPANRGCVFFVCASGTDNTDIYDFMRQATTRNEAVGKRWDHESRDFKYDPDQQQPQTRCSPGDDDSGPRFRIVCRTPDELLLALVSAQQVGLMGVHVIASTDGFRASDSCSATLRLTDRGTFTEIVFSKDSSVVPGLHHAISVLRSSLGEQTEAAKT